MAFSIPQSTIEEIRNRTDLAELVASYGIQIRRMGGSYKCCCPFHHEKTPSFVVHPDQGYYHCFGCGETGDAFKFVQKQEGLTFVEAVKKLAQQCGVTIEEKADPQAGLRRRLYALLAQLSDFYHRCLRQAAEAEGARRYLASRRLPDDVVDSFRIGYAPAGSAPILTWAKKYGFADEELYAAGVLARPRRAGEPPYHPFGGRLMFTICDRQGRPVAFSGRILDAAKSPRKYVNSPETPVFRKSNILFGLDKAAAHIVKSPGREAIVCEGQIDLIRCHCSGFANAVASQGTAFTEEHARILKKCADAVVLVFDADEAGQKAAVRSGGEFLAEGMPVRVATLPAGEDPDSLLRDRGPEAFRACLDKAESVTRFQVRTLLAKEDNPASIDAVARVGRAALETLAKCPSSLIRASLMKDAADMLGVPVSALEEDLALILRKRPRPAAAAVAPKPAPAPAPVPAEMDAAAPRNNPPSARELSLCEFLFDHERDASLLPLVRDCLPAAVLAHEFTRRFVVAWLAELADGGDAIAALRHELAAEECRWLDGILLSNDRSGASELGAERILQDYIRRLWAAELRRIQGRLPSESTPEGDARRLFYSTLIRRLQRDPWPRVRPLLDAGILR
ncbi:MAG: DNA primase [Kiritimatiellia bacterium]